MTFFPAKQVSHVPGSAHRASSVFSPSPFFRRVDLRTLPVAVAVAAAAPSALAASPFRGVVLEANSAGEGGFSDGGGKGLLWSSGTKIPGTKMIYRVTF